MNLSRPQKILFTTLAALGMTAGGAAIGNAATTASSSTPTTDTSTNRGTTDEAAETAQLKGQAKITGDQARQAALVAVPGTASDPVLENENGNVVYGVEIQTATGVVDVKVDASNATVLTQVSGDDNERDSTNESDPNERGTDTPDTGPSAG